MHPRAAELIARLELVAHVEGGYFREIHRSALTVAPGDGRAVRTALTSIYFLLTAGGVSRWHRVASDEAWHFIEGDPLELVQADTTFGQISRRLLGRHDGAAEPVHVVPAGSWQAARSTGEYTLVSCTVGPGFEYADFELLQQLPEDAERMLEKHPLLAAFA